MPHIIIFEGRKFPLHKRLNNNEINFIKARLSLYEMVWIYIFADSIRLSDAVTDLNMDIYLFKYKNIFWFDYLNGLTKMSTMPKD